MSPFDQEVYMEVAWCLKAWYSLTVWLSAGISVRVSVVEVCDLKFVEEN